MTDDTVKVIDLGYEGGGRTVFGRQSTAGWVFWSEGTSVDVDENDDVVLRTWITAERPDLMEEIRLLRGHAGRVRPPKV